MYQLNVLVPLNGFVEIDVEGKLEKLKRENVSNTHSKVTAQLEEGQLIHLKHAAFQGSSNNSKGGFFKVVNGDLKEVNSQPPQ
ncbi:MAG: hypothetical protein WBB28_25235 [Crinalium sp.]